MDREYGAQDALAFVRRDRLRASEVAFDAAMQKARAVTAASESTPRRRAGGTIREIGVGMLGYAFMGKAHANGYRTLAYMAWPPPLQPRLVSIAGRDEAAVGEAARRYGFERSVTDWKELVADPEVELFDNSGPNDLHAEPTLAAARGGKARHLREAARARRAEESFEIWQRCRGRGRRPHVRVQLPLRAGRPPRPADARGRRARRDPSLPRPLPPGVGGDRPTRRGGSTRPPPARARSAISVRTSSTSRATSSARSPGRGGRDRRSSRGATSTTRSRRRSPSTAARSGRSRRRASPQGARTRSAGRSTARKGRSRSTSSGRTSSR